MRPDYEVSEDDRYQKWIVKQKAIDCPCCYGSKIQYCEKSGMREICPGCKGTGNVANPDYKPYD